MTPDHLGATVRDPAVQAKLDDRYGVPTARRRRIRTGIVTVLSATAVAYVVWVAEGQATPAVRATVVGYSDITPTSVTIRFEVTKDADATVVCRVRARNAQNLTIGSADVRVAPPEHGADSVVETVLRTSERPVNGEVQTCRPA